jgi:ribosome-binding factor A
MRQVPLLTFIHDDSAPRALRIEQLLEEIDREGKQA